MTTLARGGSMARLFKRTATTAAAFVVRDNVIKVLSCCQRKMLVISFLAVMLGSHSVPECGSETLIFYQSGNVENSDDNDLNDYMT